MDEINLCEIMNAFPECINNGSRLKAVLKDLYPGTPKAVINILGTMADCGICKEFCANKQLTAFDTARWQKKLEHDYGFSANLVDSCFDLFVQYNSYSTRVVGVTYDGRQQLIEKLVNSDELKVGTRLLIEPDLHNKFDPYALKVLTVRKEVLGYISKEISKEISSEIKKGRLYAIVVTSVLGRDFHEFSNFFNWGIEINIIVYKQPIKQSVRNTISNNDIKIGTILWHNMYGAGVLTDIKIEQREKYLTVLFKDKARTFLQTISLNVSLFTLDNIPKISYDTSQKNVDSFDISNNDKKATEYIIDDNDFNDETDW